jgi:hypothetical protein
MSSDMRGLSARQPRAFCIAKGFKPVENRTRPIPRCLIGTLTALLRVRRSHVKRGRAWRAGRQRRARIALRA